MATLALMAWSVGTDPPAMLILTITTHHGRLDADGTVAVFPGIAEALAAAVGVQRITAREAVGRAIAVTVAELDGDREASAAPAASVVRGLAAAGAAGEIWATDVVQLLMPLPDCGRWDDTRDRPGAHRLLWSPAVAVEPLTVVVAEDVAIIRAGIVSLLSGEGITVVGEAADYDAILATVRRTRPRLLITDVRMPPGQSDEGLRAAAVLRSEQPDLAVLVLSQHVQASAAADLLTSQTSGIGYLLKERVTAFDEFLGAARTVAAGGTVIDPLITRELLAKRRTGDQFDALADRERAVLDLMAQGLSNTAIADRSPCPPGPSNPMSGRS